MLSDNRICVKLKKKKKKSSQERRKRRNSSKNALSRLATRGQTDAVKLNSGELDSYVCVFACSVYVNVYLLINVVILVVLQAAGGLCGVREGGTLRVVLRAPETIFPQLVTFCKMDGQNREMCYQGWVIPLLNDTQSHIISHT